MVIKRKLNLERTDFQWRPWFAWFPVNVGYGKTAWLQWVEKKRLGVGWVYSL